MASAPRSQHTVDTDRPPDGRTQHRKRTQLWIKWWNLLKALALTACDAVAISDGQHETPITWMRACVHLVDVAISTQKIVRRRQ
jgi:hypothetical protein